MLHVDLDEFVAAVEVLRRPELAGREVVVGGRGDPSERAVVSTASYAARERGVRSGMPLRTAARKAPDATFLPVDGEHYTAVSGTVMEVLRATGALVEVLGWDEAFLGVDVDDPEAFAERVRADVLAATRLHSSVGIGDNRVRAKIATGFAKPRGAFRLTADNWVEVMAHRPVRDLWGVGAKVAGRLAGLGIRSVADLAAAEPAVLAGELGPKLGPWYGSLGRGEGSAVVDDSPWVARGHSRETTFQRNVRGAEEVGAALRTLTAGVMEDVAADGRPVVRVGLKIRYAPFETTTRSRALPAHTRDAAAVLDAVLALAAAAVDPERELRLLGVRAEMEMPHDAVDPVARTPLRGRV
ncbi:MAG TPA: DNA polymerase IV [Dermatophilaceae bacterium]|nr:DNA polymerase IV [Dermatophilaceae bacterium]